MSGSEDVILNNFFINYRIYFKIDTGHPPSDLHLIFFAETSFQPAKVLGAMSAGCFYLDLYGESRSLVNRMTWGLELDSYGKGLLIQLRNNRFK